MANDNDRVEVGPNFFAREAKNTLKTLLTPATVAASVVIHIVEAAGAALSEQNNHGSGGNGRKTGS